MNADTREFLLKDWEAAHASRENYANMRLVVLGVSITVIGFVLTLAKDASPSEILNVWMLLLIVLVASVQMLGAINRGVHVFAIHMQLIEEKLGEVGFASSWCWVIRSTDRDAVSAAIRTALWTLNLGVAAYLSVSLAGVSMPGAMKTIVAVSGASVLTWNGVVVHRMRPKYFLGAIEAALRRSWPAIVDARRSIEPPNIGMQAPAGDQPEGRTERPKGARRA